MQEHWLELGLCRGEHWVTTEKTENHLATRGHYRPHYSLARQYNVLCWNQWPDIKFLHKWLWYSTRLYFGYYSKAIFVSALFDLTELYTFVDDNFSLSSKNCKAKTRLQAKLQMVTAWLTSSGLKVNENKTELCLFYRKDTNPMEIILYDVKIVSEKIINILVIIFDSKLT